MDEDTHRPESPTLLLDRYRIDGMLGEGGLGTVYKAYDTRLKRFVAIKTLKRSVYADDPDMFRILEERFRREAEAGSRMHVHPNLVVVHDFVTDSDKSLYLVQEFVPGGTLADRLARDGALPQGDALRLAGDVARGLSAAHEMHIVHRDIKPANIFISADGRARVGDFGIAQLDALSGRTKPTSGHPGTPLYMSPEQAGSSGYVRPESDQYSLGLVVFEMLTGQPYKRLRKRQADELLSQQPLQIQMLNRRMIADDSDDRYESMKDVATEIGRIERQLATSTMSGQSSPIPAQGIATLPETVTVTDLSVVATEDDDPNVSRAGTVQETERERPRANLLPMALTVASLTPPSAVPASKAISRRRVIIGLSALAVAGTAGGTFVVSHGQRGGGVETATPVAGTAPSSQPTAIAAVVLSPTPFPPSAAAPVTLTTDTPIPTIAPSPTQAVRFTVLGFGTTAHNESEVLNPADSTNIFYRDEQIYAFVNYDGAVPDRDTLQVVLISFSIPLTYPLMILHKSSGFAYISLGSLTQATYALELHYNDTVLPNRTTFSTVTRPTPVPANATPVPLFGGILAVDQLRFDLGRENSSATITLFNNSNAPIKYATKASVVWLSLEPTDGTVPANGSVSATIRINRVGLPSGAYYGSVIITATIGSGTSTTSISVSFGT